MLNIVQKRDASSKLQSADGGSRRAFTIIEMMVTIAILAMMIGSFSAILVQCQRVVGAAHKVMRANTKAAAIERVIRRDIHRMTKGGVLAITNIPTGGEPGLVITTGEPVDSITTNAQGLGSFVVYTTKPNKADNSTGAILWRPEYVFSAVSGDDTMSTDLTEVQAYSRTEADSEVNSLLSGPVGLDLYMPPVDLDQLADIWQVLTEGCDDLEISELEGYEYDRGLSIMWTDGSVNVSGELNWYGIDRGADGAIVPVPSGITEIESVSGSSYEALWTADTVRYWPKAIKIAFNIIDPEMPPEMQSFRYEFVCEVRP